MRKWLIENREKIAAQSRGDPSQMPRLVAAAGLTVVGWMLGGAPPTNGRWAPRGQSLDKQLAQGETGTQIADTLTANSKVWFCDSIEVIHACWANPTLGSFRRTL